jgi:hypothetical protein
MIEHKISEDLKQKILDKLIEPYYYNNVDTLITDKNCWRKTGSAFETISKIFISFGAILSFSSGYYNYPTLSFISGAVSTISLAFLQFSSFAHKEKNRNIAELNQMLTKLNLETVPTEENDKKNDNDNEQKNSNIDEINKKLTKIDSNIRNNINTNDIELGLVSNDKIVNI